MENKEQVASPITGGDAVKQNRSTKVYEVTSPHMGVMPL